MAPCPSHAGPHKSARHEGHVGGAPTLRHCLRQSNKQPMCTTALHVEHGWISGISLPSSWPSMQNKQTAPRSATCSALDAAGGGGAGSCTGGGGGGGGAVKETFSLGWFRRFCSADARSASRTRRRRASYDDGVLSPLSSRVFAAQSPSRAASPPRRRGRSFPSARPSRCLLYTSPSPRDGLLSRMPSSA